MRRIKRRKAKRNKQIIIISTMCLLFCLCAGYAAFQTNISITAKGNVYCGGTDATDKMIADSFVESGSGLSGLYKDSYENDRYVYRGSDVNNYITFNGEPWRIIAIESNGTLKIMQNGDLNVTRTFDPNSRTGGYCAKGNAPIYGCNAWATIESFSNGNYEGEVTADSPLNGYLNGEYYNSLSSTAKSLIVDYPYNIGAVEYSSTLTMEEQLTAEAKYKWEGKVALINLSDFIRSNSNDDNYCNTLYGNSSSTYYTTCRNTTWMYTSLSSITSDTWWTITPVGSSTYLVYRISGNSHVSSIYAYNTNGVHPVVHLTSDLKLCGSGTSDDPYTIVD